MSLGSFKNVIYKMCLEILMVDMPKNQPKPITKAKRTQSAILFTHNRREKRWIYKCKVKHKQFYLRF